MEQKIQLLSLLIGTAEHRRIVRHWNLEEYVVVENCLIFSVDINGYKGIIIITNDAEGYKILFRETDKVLRSVHRDNVVMEIHEILKRH